jgi:hypothetical protein
MSNRQRRETFVIALQPLPGVNGIRALRRGLKILLRVCRLRCVSISVARATAKK